MKTFIILIPILHSLQPTVAQGALPRGTRTSISEHPPLKMTAALVPSAQLRMRGSANNINHVVSSPYSSHESPKSWDFKYNGNRRRRQQRQQLEMSASSSSSSVSLPEQSWSSSKITNYNPWRQKRSQSNRATTVLHSHSKEKSSDALELDSEEGIEDLEIDSSLHQMEKGSGSTDDKVTVTTPESSTNSVEILGIPIQSIILLNLVAVIWGTQHAVVKTVVDDSASFIGLFKWMENMGINLSTVQTSVASVGSADGGGTAAYFTLARFGLAALLASPFTPGLRSNVENAKENPVDGMGNKDHKQSQQDPSKTGAGEGITPITQSHTKTIDDRESIKLAWKFGAELGLYMFLGYAFQAVGLETTTASRSGFLLYLNVKFVPFFSYFLFGKQIQRSTWISALVAFGGTALLAFDNANGASSNGQGLGTAFTVGDLWCIAAAAVSAMFILRMEAASKAVPKSSELNAATLWTVAVLSLLWTMGISWNSLSVTGASADASSALVRAIQQTFQQTISTITTHPLALIYLSGVTTALANFLQSKAQKDVSAERASVIYAMDPVYGAIFANILLGETLGGLGLVGAFMILVAAATNAFLDFGGAVGNEASGTEKEKI